jgi:hypothetical protein
MKSTQPAGDGSDPAALFPQWPDPGHKAEAGEDAEALAALTFDLTLVAGRPCLVTEGPYDVGRIRLF